MNSEWSEEVFPATRWSLISSLKDGGEDSEKEFWDWFSSHYWQPIYCFLCATGKSKAEAEDLTQEFFNRAFTQNILKDAREDRGKLRTYVLSILKRMLSKIERDQNAQKRGGGCEIVSLDSSQFEWLETWENSQEKTPEQIYEHCWAHHVVQSAQKKLKSEFEDEERLEIYERLESYILNEESRPSYEDLAQQMKASPGAMRLLVFRLRRRFRDLVDEEIVQTVSATDEFDSERQWLLQTLRG